MLSDKPRVPPPEWSNEFYLEKNYKSLFDGEDENKLYDLFGVNKNTSIEDIKKVFRKKVLYLNPSNPPDLLKVSK